MYIKLVRVPGTGQSTVEMPEGSTVADLVTKEGLDGRDIFLNGQGVQRANYASTELLCNCQVFATGSVKGN